MAGPGSSDGSPNQWHLWKSIFKKRWEPPRRQRRRGQKVRETEERGSRSRKKGERRLLQVFLCSPQTAHSWAGCSWSTAALWRAHWSREKHEEKGEAESNCYRLIANNSPTSSWGGRELRVKLGSRKRVGGRWVSEHWVGVYPFVRTDLPQQPMSFCTHSTISGRGEGALLHICV